jgi:hypothetical protein
MQVHYKQIYVMALLSYNLPVPDGATVLEEPWPPSRHISIRLFSEPSLSSH